MAQAYTRLLARASGFGVVSGASLITAPTGYATVIRDILINCIGRVDQYVMLQVLAGETTTMFWRSNVSDYQPFHLELRQVLPPTNTLQLWTEGEPWSCFITGYQLYDD